MRKILCFIYTTFRTKISISRTSLFIKKLLPTDKIQARKRKSYVKIPEETRTAILEYYLDSGNSYICPGERDCVKTRDLEGNKITLQKRLLMYTVHDLYLNFIEDHKEKLDVLPKFSYFASLKPIQCKVAGDPGSHNICVCPEHENIKLRLLALKNNVHYRDILEKSVCNLNDINCMLHRCENCPGLIKIKEMVESNMPDDHTNITYKFWVEQGSRASLESLTENANTFMSKLCEDLWKLTVHHFIAQEQKRFLKESKETIDIYTAIIIKDFSENYSFMIQNSVQAFYYNNLQATIHPFIMWYKIPGKEPGDEPQLSHANFCIISDTKDHFAYTVHAFIDELMQVIRTEYPSIQKIIYCSDGAPQQYKNKLVRLV